MAKPITTTPTLRGKEAQEFICKVHRGMEEPARLVATPKLEQAKRLVQDRANGVKK